MSNDSIESAQDRLTLTPQEVASTLGVSRSFVYDEIAAGRLPHVRLGARRVLVERAEFLEFLKLRRWSAAEAASRYAKTNPAVGHAARQSDEVLP